MTDDTLPFPVADYLTGDGGITEKYPNRENTKPLPESFGRNLDTLEKARLWLTNPHNWHSGKLFIMKWNGLLCSVMEEHGRKLIDNPEDMGLPWCAVYGQKTRRAKKDRGESMDEPQSPITEEQDG